MKSFIRFEYYFSAAKTLVSVRIYTETAASVTILFNFKTSVSYNYGP